MNYNQRKIRGLTSLVGNTPLLAINFSFQGRDAVVVTMFPDDNKKYLSTGLLNEEPQKDRYLTPGIKLREVTAFKRVCCTCCDPRECMEAASVDIETEGSLPHCPRRP